MEFFSIIAAVLLSAITGMFSRYLASDYWYDFYHYYYDIDKQYTTILDDMLLDERRGIISNCRFLNNNFIPAEGIHYYSISDNAQNNRWLPKILQPGKWIGLIKYTNMFERNAKSDKNDISYYRAFVPPAAHKAFINLFIKFVKTGNADSIRVMHIDSAKYDTELVPKNDIYKGDCRENQLIAVKEITDLFEKSKFKSVKVMLSGKRGVGKTYIGKILKKTIDHQYNKNCQLYNNFDPAQIGLDIVTALLVRAKRDTPIILVINEIDVIYERTCDQKDTNDARSCHTKNKSTFNNMLDAIDNTANIIVIFTSEISAKELYKNTLYRSFMREGRIDSFIQVDTDSSVVMNRQDVCIDD